MTRFNGEGVPSLRGYGRGDLFVEIEVKIPTRLTARQEELLREFGEIDKEKSEGKFRKWPWNRRKEREREAARGAARP